MKYATGLLPLFLLGVWVHSHTDEIPVVFGSLGLFAFGLASFFPQRFVVSGLMLGLAPLSAELLVRFGVLRAPWPPTPARSLPLIVAVCMMPPLVGGALGWLLRKGV